MGNEIPLQLAQFFRSVLLGASLALVYDLARALHRLGGRAWRTSLDILVSFSAAASLFLFIMSEEGELRLFFLLGAVCGAILFFSLISRFFRPVWVIWVDIFMIPIRFGHKFLKFIHKICKKVFSFFRKWFTITNTLEKVCAGEGREHGAKAVKTETAPQQQVHPAASHRHDRRRRLHAAQYEHTARECPFCFSTDSRYRIRNSATLL